METSERVRSIREKTGLNRREFSDKYGIPVRTLEEWEAGRRTPPEYVVRLLSYVVEFQLAEKKD